MRYACQRMLRAIVMLRAEEAGVIEALLMLRGYEATTASIRCMFVVDGCYANLSPPSLRYAVYIYQLQRCCGVMRESDS